LTDIHFFYNYTATSYIYTLSLHDALPISIPVFISLYLFYLISHEIIKDNPFYIKNVSRLTIVSRLALLEAAFYLFALIMLIILSVFQVSLLLIIIIVMFIAL